jgi:hypothetical protein
MFHFLHQDRTLTGDGFISVDLAIFGIQMSSGRLVFGLGTVLYTELQACRLFHTEPLESPGNTRAFSVP